MSDPDRAVFRLPLVAVVFPVLLFVMVTPLAAYRPSETAAYNPFLLALYLIPVLGLLYPLITRTVVTSERITATTMVGRKRITWSELDGFEFHGSRWAIAVTTAGGRVRLPMVRPRDLPRLAAVSGGRLNLGDPQPAESPQSAKSPQPAESTD